MGQHNREGKGTDQQGFDYKISYQPSWLKFVKVTRDLDSGRQSTKMLFRNPMNKKKGTSSERTRTRIVSPSQELDLEISVLDRKNFVERVEVTCVVPTTDGRAERVVYTLEDGLLSSPTRR